MLLQTSIKPRREGVVIVTGLDGSRLAFEPNAAGELECAVDHEPTVAHLIATQNFYPADEADYAAAMELSQAALSTQTEPVGTGAPAGEPSQAALAQKTDDELDLEDDEGDPDALPVEGAAAALPIEAETPPQTDPARAARKNAALQKAAAKK